MTKTDKAYAAGLWGACALVFFGTGHQALALICAAIAVWAGRKL